MNTCIGLTKGERGEGAGGVQINVKGVHIPHHSHTSPRLVVSFQTRRRSVNTCIGLTKGERDEGAGGVQINVKGVHIPHHSHTSTQILFVPPVLSACPLHTNSGCGKERRILIGPW